MAWRIAELVESGEIDNRVKGRVKGHLDLVGGAGRITLDLVGNAHPDVAASLVRFRNPRTKPGTLDGFFPLAQTGTAGDITASHRVKDLLVPLEIWKILDDKARESAFEWANCFYIEWFSPTNGRVVIEGIRFETEVVEGPLWTLTDEDMRAQAEAVESDTRGFLEAVGEAMLMEQALRGDDDGEAIPPAEADMDREAARMDLLVDRVARRLEKEGCSMDDWERIHEEESARLRRERGEPEPEPLTPGEQAEQDAWIEEMNAAAGEALEDARADAWKTQDEHRDHPLVLECRELSLKLCHVMPEEECASHEHPLEMVCDGVMIATGKLAGALNGMADGDEWPPDSLRAPSVLLFLKKARHHLRDAILGLDAADEEKLATAEWRQTARANITRILLPIQKLILEARATLEEDGM